MDKCNLKKYIRTKEVSTSPAWQIDGTVYPKYVVVLKSRMNSMAWCFCDTCDYKDKCEYYRKVVVCPYLKIEKNK